MSSGPSTPWWRNAVIYEIYVRSYADGDGDGVGDLRGITERLDHVAGLGADGVWLTPFYPSPMADHGYDVADPRGVDRLFGTLDDFDRLVAAAHERGLRLLIDLVPNHSSSAHPWFVEALASPPGSPARERYIFRDGRGADGGEPPNNWPSTFGGPAWSRVPDGQWYLHLFASGQPDLNWRHPDVATDYDSTLRFWLDRGVDGFRIDVAHGLFKDPTLPDVSGKALDLMAEEFRPNPMWNQPEVHDVYRHWREVCAEYPHEPAMVGEVWLGDQHAAAAYARADELHLAFNFPLLFAPWDGVVMRHAVERTLDGLAGVGGTAAWAIGNHDVTRVPTRYGGGAVGDRRARALVLLLLGLPGAAFLYAGDELGLPEAELPDDALQDPIWEMTGHRVRGRDGCRVPVPWTGTRPPYGFSPDGARTWLPMPEGWEDLTVAAQDADPASMLALHRTALVLRRTEPGFGAPALRWHRHPAPVLDFERPAAGGGVRVVVNCADRPHPLPPGEVLLASEPLGGAALPPDAAVWVRSPADALRPGGPVP